MACEGAPKAVATVVICVVVSGSVLWLAFDSWRANRGSRWFASMVGAMLFGEVVEWTNTHDVGFLRSAHGSHVILCYPDLPINVLGVPFWVPVGWGGIIYAATWMAQRLRLPLLREDELPLAHQVGRAIAAAFLAASVDFSLDPVARLAGFWSWRTPAVSFAGVPYDNFIGWYLIVFLYAFTAERVLRVTHRYANVPAARWTPRWWTSVAVQCGAALACALVATLVFLSVEWAVVRGLAYSSVGDDGRTAAKIFIATTGVGALVTVLLVRKPAHEEDPLLHWPILVVPVAMHVACYGLYLWLGDWREPMLVAAIPIQLSAGVLIFAQPWLRRL